MRSDVLLDVMRVMCAWRNLRAVVLCLLVGLSLADDPCCYLSSVANMTGWTSLMYNIASSKLAMLIISDGPSRSISWTEASDQPAIMTNSIVGLDWLPSVVIVPDDSQRRRRSADGLCRAMRDRHLILVSAPLLLLDMLCK